MQGQEQGDMAPASTDAPAEPAQATLLASSGQEEMPFAVVQGEPVTQLPKDLFIPPQALEVFLEAFEGPLDLLLYLIKRQNIDIVNIPIADITHQYVKYIELMQNLQLELAGEYLVMAATLAEIKSRMLLPRPVSDDDHDEEDPRAELIRRLQEYERYKKAAERLEELPRQERDVWTASSDVAERVVVKRLPEVTLKALTMAFKDAMERAEKTQHFHVRRERLSVRQRMTEILDRLTADDFVELIRLFKVEDGRAGVVVSFLAVLELCKETLVEVVQSEPYAPIHVRAAANAAVVVVDDAEMGYAE